MDIAFSCERCGQHITIDEAGAGMEVDCPTCGHRVRVPAKKPPAPPSKNDASSAPEWFYTAQGERVGPVTEARVRSLIAQGKIARETKLWKQGYADWTPLERTQFGNCFSSPPPLTGENVSNAVVWFLALVPVVGMIIERIIGEVTNIATEQLWFITLGLNITLGYWDEFRLRKAGHKTVGKWLVWLIPVYLFQRAKLLRQRRSYFYVWILCFVVSVMITVFADVAVSSEDLSKLKNCQVAYMSDVGPAAAGISFGGFLDTLSASKKDWKVTKSADGSKTIVSVRANGKELKLHFACNVDQHVCIISGGEVDGQRLDAMTAMGAMVALVGR